jgi:hypothetical protein
MLCEEFAHLKLDKFQHLLVLHGVDLVHKYHNLLDPNLTRKQQMFSCLEHFSITCCHHDDCAVHVRCTGDHVLGVFGVTGAIDVRVVSVVGVVFNVCGGNCDAFLPFFWGLVDRAILEVLRVALLGLSFRDRG